MDRAHCWLCEGKGLDGCKNCETIARKDRDLSMTQRVTGANVITAEPGYQFTIFDMIAKKDDTPT